MRTRAAQVWPQLDLFVVPFPTAPVAPPAPLAPLAFLAPARWELTRPWLVSPHRARALRELDAVRAHFPELDDVTVKVGLTKRRSVLGLAAASGPPMIWIRPRRIRRFAIAHELTHLLQARDLVPGGEKSCDLFALARAHEYVDVAPFYLRIPERLVVPESDGALRPGVAAVLHGLAREAIAGRTVRSALRWFEQRVATLPES